MYEGFTKFSREKLDGLRARYRGDVMFRTFSSVLCTLEIKYGELGAVEVWSETENLRQRLSAIGANRDSEIPFLFNELIAKHQLWLDDTGKVLQRRSVAQAKHTAVIIFTVLLEQLANAGKDDDLINNPNAGLCMAITRCVGSAGLLDQISVLNNLFRRIRVDNEGKEIVFPVTDYMAVKSPLELMDEEAAGYVDAMAGEIVNITSGVRPSLKIRWETYEGLWRRICSESWMMESLKLRRPRSANNTWGRNWTLVANILGIMMNTSCAGSAIISGAVSSINASLGINVKSYLSNHMSFGTTDTALTREQHKIIERIIAEEVKNLC